MKIEIYTKLHCPYCHRAKELLNSKGLAFIEYDLSNKPELKQDMIKRTDGMTTVPQIFLNEKYLSDSDGLFQLEHTGKLDYFISNSPNE